MTLPPLALQRLVLPLNFSKTKKLPAFHCAGAFLLIEADALRDWMPKARQSLAPPPHGLKRKRVSKTATHRLEMRRAVNY
jgi:hypothetical protein